MIQTIHAETFRLPPVNPAEVFRYTGVRTAVPELAPLLDAVLAEMTPQLTGKVCWLELPIARKEGILDLGFTQTDSSSLARNLEGCDRIVVFGATIGLAPDRLIARYGHISPAKALMFQAAGTERIEALCDVFCDKLCQEAAARGLSLRPRFSPGYGDLPLALQKDIFRVLDCARMIGLTLNESLLMSPSKSVTAIAGLGPGIPEVHQRDCRQCQKTDCTYRRIP